LADPRLDDPEFSVENGTEYRIEERVLRSAADRPEVYELFLRGLVAPLRETGRVTRFSATTIAAPDTSP
jgi:hypothetical protein